MLTTESDSARWFLLRQMQFPGNALYLIRYSDLCLYQSWVLERFKQGMKYATAAGLLLASFVSKTVDVASAQQAPLPPVTIYGPKPQTSRHAQSADAPKANANSKK